MTEMYLAGVDEAGRGPVLGPLVIAGVVLHKDDLEALVEKGLKDSKLIQKETRESLYDEIIKKAVDYKVIIIEAHEIDAQRLTAINLNRIELNTMATILTSLKDWSKAYVDACDPNAKKFELTLQNTVNANIIAEHFADKKYPIVSAASVVAKVIRDREILKAHEEFGVDFGSGYPHDPKTNKFLTDYYSKHGELPIVARKSWETARKIVRMKEQSLLENFFTDAE